MRKKHPVIRTKDKAKASLAIKAKRLTRARIADLEAEIQRNENEMVALDTQISMRSERRQ